MHWWAARRMRGCTGWPIARTALALALLFVAPTAYTARAQAAPAGVEQGIFELRVARVATETMTGLLSPAAVVLLPLDRVLALTEMPVQRTDSSVTVQRARGAGSATIMLRSRRVVTDSGSIVLNADDLLRVDGVYYLATTRIADLLRADVNSDLGQLAVTLTRSPPFPVEQRLARAQRTSSPGDRITGHAGAPLTPFVPHSGGAVLDWNVASSATSTSVGGANGSVRVAAALFGGDVSAGTGVVGSGGGEAQVSYRRGFPDNNVVRQVQLGDIVAGGTQLRSVRGLTITNARLVMDPFFGNVPLDLSLPQGWQYEVYQDNQLIGFSDPGSLGPLYVPLRYGNTPVQVHLVSPTGDETVRDFNYLVPPSQQQPGRFEYTAGGGRCASQCESSLFGTASYGVAPWLSVSAGAERLVTDGVAQLRPEGGVSLVSYSGWNAQLQAARNSFERASVVYAGMGRLIGAASYTRSYNGAGQPSVIADAAGTRWLFDGSLQRRGQSAGWLGGVRLDNSMEGVRTGDVERTRTVLTSERQRGNFGLSYETDRTRDLRQMGVSALSVLSIRSRPTSVLTSVLFKGTSVQALEVSTSLQTGRRGAAAITTRWQQGTGLVTSIGYTGVLGGTRLTSRFSASPSQLISLATTASGSAALDGSHPPALFEGPGVGLAGLSGRVYYDLDGDGRFSTGDSAAVGVRVVASGAQTRSDASGAYHVWNVVPYEPVEVSIDTLAFRDPSWMLRRGRTLVRATPGMFNHLDFPLVRTRELAGEVVADSGIATAGGVTLLLTPADGSAPLKIVTFSDGSYYVSRVRPGSYTLTVSAAALEALGAEAAPASQSVVVTTSAEEPVLDLPAVRLRRRGAQARSR